MCYTVIVKDPIIVAVISALIGILLLHIYGLWKHRQKRNAGLKILKHQLQNQLSQLDSLAGNLSTNKICVGLDPISIIYFLHSEIIDLTKNETLITSLYKHLDNIELIKRALDLINMRSAGFTSVQEEQKKSLEDNLKESISDCKSELEQCIINI